MKDKESKQELNDVLVFQDKQLKEIQRINPKKIDVIIDESEKLLNDLGYSLPNLKKNKQSEKKNIQLSDWDDIVLKAREAVGSEHQIDELFTDDELIANKKAVKAINHH